MHGLICHGMNHCLLILAEFFAHFRFFNAVVHVKFGTQVSMKLVYFLFYNVPHNVIYFLISDYFS